MRDLCENSNGRRVASAAPTERQATIVWAFSQSQSFVNNENHFSGAQASRPSVHFLDRRMRQPYACAFVAPGAPGRVQLESLRDRLVAVGGKSAVRMLFMALDNLETAHIGNCVDSESVFPKIRHSCQVLVDLAWEKLHTGDWKDVDEAWRDLFVIASLAKVDALSEKDKSALPRETLKGLDVASLLGGPTFRVELEDAIARAQLEITKLESTGNKASTKKRPYEDVDQADCKKNTIGDDASDTEIKRALPPGSLGECTVYSLETLRDLEDAEVITYKATVKTIASNRYRVQQLDALPSMESFLLEHMVLEKPVVLCGLAKRWPAFERWKSPDYLRSTAGMRSVPVELGKHFMHESYHQALLPLGEFLDEYVLLGGETRGFGNKKNNENPKQTQTTGYLAQHALFDQIPGLRNDIITPDYCALSLIREEGDAEGDGEESTRKKVSTQKSGENANSNATGLRAVNAWLGPRGTVSPTHCDPTHNLLTQVVGKKYVRLWAPSCEAALYLSNDVKERNVSRVDPKEIKKLKESFAKFIDAPFFDAVLEPGDALYIPPKWFHYVQSLTSSFSVSFWWM